MALSLKLNLGGSTINLNDGTNYKVLDTWNPRVANYKVSQFGGLLYQEVVENIPLYIFGTTAALVYEKLEDIIVALNQARAWRLGAITDPVLLEFLPNNSSLGAVVQAACLGTPAEASDLYAAAQFGLYMAGNSFETLIDLPIVRRGVWLGVAETPAATSEIDNPGAMSVTFAASLRIPSPVKLAFATPNEVAGSGAGEIFQGYVFVADVADKIVLLEAESLTTDGTGWSNVADTTASGGSKKRQTPASASLASLTKTSLSINTGARIFAVYANVTNISSSVTYTLQASMRPSGGTSADDVLTRPYVVPVSFGKQVVYLGTIALTNAATQVVLKVTPSAGSGAGHELDIDYVVVLCQDEFTKAISFFNVTSLEDLTIDHRLLTYPSPTITKTFAGGAGTGLAHAGDLYINSVGTNLTARICGTTGTSRFVITDETGSPVVVGFTMTATRRTAYLVVR